MILNLAVLVFCAAITVAAVRFLVIQGIETTCDILHLSIKTKGQIIGYATSLPELVVVTSSALMGVFDAGFWNIASSNIINWCLFFSAIVVYRQSFDLLNKTFIDEISFGLLSVAIPLALYRWDIQPGLGIAVMLLGFFALYRIIDMRLNRPPKKVVIVQTASKKSLAKGIVVLVVGVLLILIAGRFLGSSAQALIVKIGMPSWLVGWILGLITSIPEMTSFFEIYRLEKLHNRLEKYEDTQEALDALVASNMCNLGLILPLGVLVFAIVG